MAEVNLSSAVRSNLTTLQSTADLLAKTQNNLATGNKVNSALDNPGSFFTASGLNSRASDLSTLLDDQGQALQTIKAADKGISAITKLVESAKAKANQALQTQSQFQRDKLSTQYNELLEQIEDLAKDSSYKGKNLLGGDGNDLEVIFNEDNTSKLKVEAVDFTDTTKTDGLNLADLVEGLGGTSQFDLQGGSDTLDVKVNGVSGDPLTLTSNLVDSASFASGDALSFASSFGASGTPTGTATTDLAITSSTTVQDLLDKIDGIAGVEASFDAEAGELKIVSNDTITVRNDDGSAGTPAPANLATATAATFTATSNLVDSASFKEGDTLTLEDGNGFELGSFEVTATSSVDDLKDFLNDLEGVDAKFSSGRITLDGDVSLNLTSDNTDFNASSFTADTNGVQVTAQRESGFSTDDKINKTISSLNRALGTLRSTAGEFGTQLSTVEIRQDFTKQLINTLEEGAGLLTLADTNQEGANLLALQTRQQLSSTALSFASRQDQSVLQLIR